VLNAADDGGAALFAPGIIGPPLFFRSETHRQFPSLFFGWF